MSEKLETLIEQLGKLTVVEALELSKKLEEAWGVSATVGASAPAAGGAPVEEKAEVDVILTGYNDNAKIPVLKKVREFTQLGLLEAKTFVEGLPKPIKQGIDKEEADKIKKAPVSYTHLTLPTKA